MLTVLAFGALAPTLAEQLKEHAYDTKEIEICQRLADAVSDLWIASVLTRAEVDKARHRLGKRIVKAVRQ